MRVTQVTGEIMAKGQIGNGIQVHSFRYKLPPMRFYAQDRLIRISLPLLNLALCVCPIQSAVRHPSTEHTLSAISWGLITFLNATGFWGTYWKVTPSGLLESRGLLMRRAARDI